MSSTRKCNIEKLFETTQLISELLNGNLHSLQKSFLFHLQFSSMPDELTDAPMKECLKSVDAFLKNKTHKEALKKAVTKMRSETLYWKNLQKLGCNETFIADYPTLKIPPPYLFDPKAFTLENIVSLLTTLFKSRTVAEHEEYIMLMQVCLVWNCIMQDINPKNQIMVSIPLVVKNKYLEYLPPIFFYTFFILEKDADEFLKTLKRNNNNIAVTVRSESTSPVVDCQSFNVYCQDPTLKHILDSLPEIAEYGMNPIIKSLVHIDPKICMRAFKKVEMDFKSQGLTFPFPQESPENLKKNLLKQTTQQAILSLESKKNQETEPKTPKTIAQEPDPKIATLISSIRSAEEKAKENPELKSLISKAKEHLNEALRKNTKAPREQRAISLMTQKYIDQLRVSLISSDTLKHSSLITPEKKQTTIPQSISMPSLAVQNIIKIATQELYDRIIKTIKKTKIDFSTLESTIKCYQKEYQTCLRFYSDNEFKNYHEDLTQLDEEAQLIIASAKKPSDIPVPEKLIEETYAKKIIRDQEIEQTSLLEKIHKINKLISEMNTSYRKAVSLQALIKNTQNKAHLLEKTLGECKTVYRECAKFYILYHSESELSALDNIDRQLNIEHLDRLTQEAREFNPNNHPNASQALHDLSKRMRAPIEKIQHLQLLMRKQLTQFKKSDTVKTFSLFAYPSYTPYQPPSGTQNHASTATRRLMESKLF